MAKTSLIICFVMNLAFSRKYSLGIDVIENILIHQKNCRKLFDWLDRRFNDPVSDHCTHKNDFDKKDLITRHVPCHEDGAIAR